jgi:hypothetical protein
MAGNGSQHGLTLSYARIAATWSQHGRILASRQFAALRPPDATHLDMSDFIVPGDEGYLAAATVEGHARIELTIRDSNVLIRIGYVAHRSLPQATATVKALAGSMLDVLNDYQYNGIGGT